MNKWAELICEKLSWSVCASCVKCQLERFYAAPSFSHLNNKHLRESPGRTHPDGLLAQPGAPRHVGPRLHRRVVGELEQRLEPLRLAVGEHRPHPGPLTRLWLRAGLVVTMVTNQLLSI